MKESRENHKVVVMDHNIQVYIPLTPIQARLLDFEQSCSNLRPSTSNIFIDNSTVIPGQVRYWYQYQYRYLVVLAAWQSIIFFSGTTTAVLWYYCSMVVFLYYRYHRGTYWPTTTLLVVPHHTQAR